MTAEMRRQLELMINAIEHWDLPGVKEQVRDQRKEEIKKSACAGTQNGQRCI